MSTQNIFMAIQIFIAFILIIVVLPQESKNNALKIEDTGTSQKYFKPKGKEAFLNKITIIFGSLLIVNSLLLLTVIK